MAKILIINGHYPYPFSEGRLNATLVERAKAFFEAQGDEVRITNITDDYDVNAEVDSHVWADTVIVQYPVNWMGAPWALKKYQDEVYTAGMDGRLCESDGRTSEEPKKNYGTGGTRQDTKYMLSVTYNAPKEAFNNPEEPMLKGMSVDDMLRPTHLIHAFCGMVELPTFVAYDVMKNPEIEADFARFDAHLKANFAKVTEAA